MAEKDIVGGIFGLTPEMYQQGLARRDTATNLAAAQLSPGQLAGFYAMEAGTGLGRAIPGLLGVEDPELVKIRDVQMMRGQFDVSTPKGLRQFAAALSAKGYGDLAVQASERAAEIDKTIAEAEAKRTEKIKQVGLTTDGRQVYQSGTEQFVLGPGGIKEPYYGKLESKTPKTEIKLPGEQQDKELRTARGKKFVELEDKAGVANSTLQVVADFSGLIDKAFTGTASGAKLTAGQLASALGVPVTGTTESEQLDQLFAALTLGQAKNLKGALSDKDVRFLKEAVGSRGLTPETLKSVVARIAREAEIDKLAYNKASKYYEGGGDIAKFNFAKTQEEATAEVNERLAKQKRLEALRKKANQ